MPERELGPGSPSRHHGHTPEESPVNSQVNNLSRGVGQGHGFTKARCEMLKRKLKTFK